MRSILIDTEVLHDATMDEPGISPHEPEPNAKLHIATETFRPITPPTSPRLAMMAISLLLLVAAVFYLYRWLPTIRENIALKAEIEVHQRNMLRAEQENQKLREKIIDISAMQQTLQKQIETLEAEQQLLKSKNEILDAQLRKGKRGSPSKRARRSKARSAR